MVLIVPGVWSDKAGDGHMTALLNNPPEEAVSKLLKSPLGTIERHTGHGHAQK